MQHGNIVSVLDLARDGEDVFLVMEFVDGPSLRQLLKARGQRGIPLGIASYIVQHAAAGPRVRARAAGGAIIHADIRPSNLLLTTSGEVRVADFGIARREGNGAGVVEGKWAYMAPEQARGEPLTPRVRRVRARRRALRARHGHSTRSAVRSPTTSARAVRSGSCRRASSSRASRRASMRSACARSSYDPRERYARMQQLIDALVEERFANGWREGASDLAALIRESAPGTGPALVRRARWSPIVRSRS